MAIESPLFQSAMELLGHSISHYNGKKELDRKLVILHLANAVELILKDLVLDAGKSLYKNPKETITIQGSLNALSESGIEIPFLNKIELLVDERNALQHRFGSPNELTVIFYMNIAKEFFKDVLKQHYGQNYEEILTQFTDPKDLVAYKLGEPTNDKELEKLQELARIHPLGALLSAWTYFESSLESFATELNLDIKRNMPLAMALATGNLKNYGINIPVRLSNKIDSMRKVRNMAAHGHVEPTLEQVKVTISTIEELERYLASLDISEIRELAKKEQEESLRRRKEHEEKMRGADEIGEIMRMNAIAQAEADEFEND